MDFKLLKAGASATVLGALFVACSSRPDVNRERMAERPWVSVSEPSPARWAEWERLAGLQARAMRKSDEALTRNMESPFHPLLGQLKAVANPVDGVDCDQLDISASSFGIPSRWQTLPRVLTWKRLRCHVPTEAEALETWLLEAEDLIESSPRPALKQWLRRQWVETVVANDIFWKTLTLSDLARDIMGDHFEAEIGKLKAPHSLEWVVWLSHLLDVQSPGSGRDIRAQLFLFAPSDAVLLLLQRRFPEDDPVVLSGLPSDVQLRHARALLNYGETVGSLAIAKKVYRKRDEHQDAAGVLVEDIYRARGEPEKRTEWLLENQRASAFKKKGEPPAKRRAETPVPDPNTQPEEFYVYVRALWGGNKTSEALNLLRATNRTALPEAIRDRVNFLYARILMERAQWADAADALASMAPKKKETVKDAKWNLALVEMHLGKFSEAVSVLESLEPLEDDRLSRSVYVFWRARCHYQLKHEEEARKLFRQVLADNPVSFYGEISQVMLEQMKTPVPVVAELPVFLNDPRRSPPPGDFQDVNLADEFQFIVSLGDDELAQTMLEAYPKESTPVDWLTASGNFEPAIQKLTEVRKKEKRLPYGFRELYFPRRYWAEFQESAKRFGLDPYLMLSIARQESIFRSRAISAAKAMGVIQLLPQTARQLHRELPETSPFRGRKFYPERLYEPAWAIELGTFFMARLYRKYGRNWIRAVGAYNAGPIPMDNWIRTRDHEDPLLFIEMIPYAETKTYIQLIFRNMLHYRRADGQDANTYITSILAAQ